MAGGRRAAPAASAGSRLLLLATLAVAGSCQAPAASPSEPVTAERTFSLCPPGTDPIDPSVTDTAIEVLRQRLGVLGVTVLAISAGNCIEVRATTTGDEAGDQAAIFGSGQVSIVPVPAEQAGTVIVGGKGPIDAEPLAEGADLAGATTEVGADEAADLTLDLAPGAAQALRTWKASHPGESLALVVDGTVVALETITGSSTDDQLTFSIAPDAPIAPTTIEAMVISGPLPPEWTQPERPQG